MSSVEQDPFLDPSNDTLQWAEVLPFEAALVKEAAVDLDVEPAQVIDLEVTRELIAAAYAETESAEVLSLPVVEAFDNALATSQLQSKSFIDKLSEKVEALISMRRYKPRAATLEDIATVVDVDMKAFSSVYANYDKNHQELRDELIEKFTSRILRHGGDWMQVIEKDGEICGFVNCCPTDKGPEDFESWEKTTDDGTLESAYNPNGKNVYVVSLSMLPGAASDQAQNMLYANQLGKVIEEGYDKVFFESRLPGLRTWVRGQCRKNDVNFSSLSEEDKQHYAEQYFKLTKMVDGKEVPVDRLIRMYVKAGNKFTRLVPNAYNDAPSMNFGAVGEYDNPLPKSIRKNWLVRKTVGKTVRLLSNSQWLMKKVF
jgi:hypothetical protein